MSYRTLRHHHDFTVLWVGQTVSEVGSRVSLFVYPLLTYALTGSTLLAALTSSANLLGTSLVLLPAGVLADRVDRRRLMRTASAVGLLAYASLVAADLAGRLTVAHLMVVALGTGVTYGVFAPAETSAVRAVVPAPDLPTALAQNQARQHVAGLVGGPLGGALYGVTRWLPFAADVASYAVSWVLLGRLRADLSPTATVHRRVRAELGEGLDFVWRRPLFRTLTVWAPLLNLTVNGLELVTVLRLIAAGFSPVAIGLVETAAGVSGILGALATPWLVERIPTGWLTVAVGWSWVPLALPLLVWNHPVAAALSLSAGIFLNPVGNTGIAAYRLSITPDELVGRVQAVSQFASFTTMPVYPVVAGLALRHLGGVGAVGLMIVLTAVVATIPTLSRAVRTVPRPAGWPVVTEEVAPAA